ncbi:MAG: MerR family DNA-binding transcriptional regulator [Actinomycetota bacterium]
MRGGEVAERAKVPPKTIRYHEDIGLLPEPPRTPSGYREYGPDAVDRLARSSGRPSPSGGRSRSGRSGRSTPCVTGDRRPAPTSRAS